MTRTRWLLQFTMFRLLILACIGNIGAYYPQVSRNIDKREKILTWMSLRTAETAFPSDCCVWTPDHSHLWKWKSRNCITVIRIGQQQYNLLCYTLIQLTRWKQALADTSEVLVNRYYWRWNREGVTIPKESTKLEKQEKKEDIKEDWLHPNRLKKSKSTLNFVGLIFALNVEIY